MDSEEFQNTQDRLNLVVRVSEGSDVASQLGSDGQGVINDQAVSAADIAIIFLHHKLGMATVRAESGSADEARLMIERYKRGENCQLMVFFCTRYEGELLDANELSRLNNFKTSIQQMGVLTHDFKDINDLLPKIPGFLLDLIRQIDDGQRVVPFSSSGSIGESGSAGSDSEIEDRGLLELQEDLEISIAEMNKALDEITKEIEIVGDRTNQSVANLHDATVEKDGKGVRTAIDQVSTSLDQMSAAIEDRIETIRESYNNIVEFAGIIMSLDLTNDESEEGFSSAIMSLPAAALGGMSSLSEMRDSLAGLPRLTTKLGRSKKRAISVLDDLVEETMQFAGSLERTATL